MISVRTAPVRALAALVLAFAPGACSSHSEAGVHVELLAERSLVAGQELPAGTGRLRVDELRWTSTEIELLGCPSALGAVRRWLLPEAHAHGESTSTRSATPIIVNAVGSDTLRIGNLLPPAGRYCSVRYQLGPADGDALGLAGAPQMRDQSFWLLGAAGPAGEELQPLELLSARVLDLTLPVELELSADRAEVSMTFRLDPERWLAELDASALVDSSSAAALLDAFQAGLSVRVE